MVAGEEIYDACRETAPGQNSFFLLMELKTNLIIDTLRWHPDPFALVVWNTGFEGIRISFPLCESNRGSSTPLLRSPVF